MAEGINNVAGLIGRPSPVFSSGCGRKNDSLINAQRSEKINAISIPLPFIWCPSSPS